MGILGTLFGIGASIPQTIDAASKLYTTEDEKLKDQQKIIETDQKPQLAQLETNRILSMSSSIFKSGWQPLTGWTCGFLVMLYYLPQIIIMTYVWGNNCISTMTVSPFPMKPDDILNLLYLLFGFGIHSVANRIVSKS